MDVTNVFGAVNEDGVEEYKVYMYTMFAKELARCIRRFVIGKVYVEPDIQHDCAIISISKSANDIIAGPIEYSCKIDGIVGLMKNDGARDAAKAVVKEYKDQIWHSLFKEIKRRPRPDDIQHDDTVPTSIEVNDYDDDVRRLYFNEHLSVEQISDSLGVHVDAVNRVVEGLINE